MPEARNLVLTQSQAACLIALRHSNETQPRIAIEAQSALAKTAAALRTLAKLGLAERDPAKRWHTTRRGKACRFDTAPDRSRRNGEIPGPAAIRLLDLLDRPMRGREIVEQLEMTHQGVRQLLIKLHAQGHVRFADPKNPFWIVARAGDKTSFLSRDEERVLSAIPREYATDANKIRLACRVPEGKVHQILERLLLNRLIEIADGPWEKRTYRITSAGLKHPQCAQSTRRARAPRLPVESDRIRNVLSVILDSGELRIKDVTTVLNLPPHSTNALMQYLKRRRLVKKTVRAYNSPYSLTAEGLAALAEMTRRQAA
jgi:DNA-binding IclR family transcriptional regulator/DNA-binding PadR family transcriptional regulator